MRAFSNRSATSKIRTAVAGISLSVLAGVAIADEPFQLVYDLRVQGTGDKTATVSLPGDEVVLDLFAIIYGTNDNPQDDRLQSGVGRFSSSTGGLLGDLVGLPSPSPFNALGSAVGNTYDADGDGDLDVGGPDPSVGRDFYSFRAGAGVRDMPAGGFHVGQVRFTARTLAEGQSTEVNFYRRGGGDDWGALFWLDGSNLSGYDGLIGIGVPVKISYLPTTGGVVEYLTGTINDHLTINRPTKPAAGTTLVIATGLDVVSGGSLDTRDDAGSHGAHEIRIQDATSGNAGGSINAGLLYVGHTGSGTFTQRGGTTRIASHLSVGHEAGAGGTLNVTAGELSGGRLTVGNSGAGTLAQSAGTVSVNALDAGVASSATGTLELTGGTLVANSATIGGAGQGTLRLRAGSLGVNSSLTLGAEPGGRGVIEIDGGTLNAGVTFVGKQGSGRVTQTGGTALLGALFLHSSSGTSSASAPASAYTLKNGTLVTGSTTVGDDRGIGQFVQDGGTFESGVYLQVLDAPHATGSRIELNGGELRSDGLLVGTQGSSRGGEYVQTGGESEFRVVSVYGGGTLRYAGGSMSVGWRLTGNGVFDFADAPVTLTAANGTLLDFSEATLKNTSKASIVAGAGSLLQFPAGFDAEAEFEDIDTQGLVHFAGERLTISASHTIGGTGSIKGDVTNAGLVSPGNSPGTLEVIGSYTQTDTGTLHVEIAGLGQDSFDLLTVQDAALLDGRLTVALLDGFTPSPSDAFTVLAADVLAGAFDNAPDKITIPQGTFDVVYDGDSVTLTNFVAVPEPAATVILLLASPLLIGRRRRRR